MIRLSCLLALLLLGGCESVGIGAGIADTKVDQAIALVKQMNDTEAKAYVAVPCAMDVGAYHRVLSPDQQRAVDLLCGGSGEKPVTVQDVKRARDLMNLVSPAVPAAPE